MKIAEKGGYKKVCFWILLCWWGIHILGYACSALFYDTQSEKFYFYDLIWSSIVIWIFISIFYGFFLFITKPLQKKQIEQVEKKETAKDKY